MAFSQQRRGARNAASRRVSSVSDASRRLRSSTSGTLALPTGNCVLSPSQVTLLRWTRQLALLQVTRKDLLTFPHSPLQEESACLVFFFQNSEATPRSAMGGVARARAQKWPHFKTLLTPRCCRPRPRAAPALSPHLCRCRPRPRAAAASAATRRGDRRRRCQQRFEMGPLLRSGPGHAAHCRSRRGLRILEKKDQACRLLLK